VSPPGAGTPSRRATPLVRNVLTGEGDRSIEAALHQAVLARAIFDDLENHAAGATLSVLIGELYLP
jgi:hypothetical protein